MSKERHIIRTLNRCRQWCKECKLFERTFLAALAIGIIGGSLYLLWFAPPRAFETPTVVRIEKGASLRAVAKTLKEKEVIKSTAWFSILLMTFGGEKGAVAGNYFFPHPQNVVTVASRVAGGDYQLAPVKVTLPEGATAKEMAQILEDKLGNFDSARFLELVQGKEGYLFPDTYYFLPGEVPETVAIALEENFFDRISTIREDLNASGKELSDLIIMASLLEEEARTTQSRQVISGILWKRIEEGMRLQVDAVFPYIVGKNTYQLTHADLAVDSPYNTYRIEGLPHGPISNPGLDSIKAAANPIETPYLYYLSDRSGNFHYSKTYEEHLRKKRLYVGT